jgi:hypothetical protein
MGVAALVLPRRQVRSNPTPALRRGAAPSPHVFTSPAHPNRRDRRASVARLRSGLHLAAGVGEVDGFAGSLGNIFGSSEAAARVASRGTQARHPGSQRHLRLGGSSPSIRQPYLRSTWEVAVLTGLRRGGLCGLRWADVDLATRKITVRRSRVSVRGKVLEQATTKTRAGLRTVPLSDAAIGALLSWQLKQAAEAGPPRRRAD